MKGVGSAQHNCVMLGLLCWKEIFFFLFLQQKRFFQVKAAFLPSMKRAVVSTLKVRRTQEQYLLSEFTMSHVLCKIKKCRISALFFGPQTSDVAFIQATYIICFYGVCRDMAHGIRVMERCEKKAVADIKRHPFIREKALWFALTRMLTLEITAIPFSHGVPSPMHLHTTR